MLVASFYRIRSFVCIRNLIKRLNDCQFDTSRTLEVSLSTIYNRSPNYREPHFARHKSNLLF